MSPPPQAPTHIIQIPHHRLRHNPGSTTSPDNLIPSTNRPLSPDPTTLPQAARIPQIATPPAIHLPITLHPPSPPLPTQQPQSHRMDVHTAGAAIRPRKSRQRPLHEPRPRHKNPSDSSQHFRISITRIRTLPPPKTPCRFETAPNGSLNATIIRKRGKPHPGSGRPNIDALPLPHRPHHSRPLQKDQPPPAPPLRPSRYHIFPDRNAATRTRGPQHPRSEGADLRGTDAAGESGLS